MNFNKVLAPGKKVPGGACSNGWKNYSRLDVAAWLREGNNRQGKQRAAQQQEEEAARACSAAAVASSREKTEQQPFLVGLDGGWVCSREQREGMEGVVVADGANWIKTEQARHFPQATCILDWAHLWREVVAAIRLAGRAKRLSERETNFWEKGNCHVPSNYARADRAGTVAIPPADEWAKAGRAPGSRYPQRAPLHHHVAGPRHPHRDRARALWHLSPAPRLQAAAIDVYRRRGAGAHSRTAGGQATRTNRNCSSRRRCHRQNRPRAACISA